MSIVYQNKTYSYRYVKSCTVCKFCRRHPDVKKVLIEIQPINPSGITIPQAIEYYKFPLSRQALRNHIVNHIFEVQTKVENRVVNSKEPIKNLGKEVIGNYKLAHEQTLDEFISQFDEAVRARQLKLTVKDGLAAIKIKADIQKADKDRKKDLLKMMVGAYEQDGPAERTEASE